MWCLSPRAGASSGMENCGGRWARYSASWPLLSAWRRDVLEASFRLFIICIASEIRAVASARQSAARA
jgi:hypothetical protein